MAAQPIDRYALGTYRYFDSYSRLDECKLVIDTCFTHGIIAFDTARSYGGGIAESILGLCLEGYERNSYCVSSKVFDSAKSNLRAGLNYKNIVASANVSLNSLRLDYIDIFYLHRYDPHVEFGEICDAVMLLLKRGYIKSVGLSMWPEDKIIELQCKLAARGYTACIYIQDMANIITEFSAKRAHALADRKKFTLYAYSPFARGLLRGSCSEFINKFKSGYWQGSVLDELVKTKFSEIIRLHAEAANCIEHTALDWCFDNGFQGVVFGVSNSSNIMTTINMIGSYREKRCRN